MARTRFLNRTRRWLSTGATCFAGPSFAVTVLLLPVSPDVSRSSCGRRPRASPARQRSRELVTVLCDLDPKSVVSHLRPKWKTASHCARAALISLWAGALSRGSHPAAQEHSLLCSRLTLPSAAGHGGHRPSLSARLPHGLLSTLPCRVGDTALTAPPQACVRLRSGQQRVPAPRPRFSFLPPWPVSSEKEAQFEC